MCTDCHLTNNKQKCKKTFYVSVTVGVYLSWHTHHVSITWHITINCAALQHILSTLPIAALGVFNSNSTSINHKSISVQQKLSTRNFTSPKPTVHMPSKFQSFMTSLCLSMCGNSLPSINYKYSKPLSIKSTICLHNSKTNMD